jgi:glycosyltransferase involved in cell wall biosynthesis
VGNLKARKGLLFLLKALAELKREGMSYPLAVIGNIERNSSDFENITSFIKENGLSVTFTGKVSEDELIGYYQRAKLNVLPSKSSRFNFEGFGLVHLEANACGTLSIGTLNSGNEDAIKQGTGFLVEYDDVPALAAAIRTVMAGRYSPPDREIVPSYNDLACDYLDIYRDVIAASGSIA